MLEMLWCKCCSRFCLASCSVLSVRNKISIILGSFEYRKPCSCSWGSITYIILLTLSVFFYLSCFSIKMNYRAINLRMDAIFFATVTEVVSTKSKVASYGAAGCLACVCIKALGSTTRYNITNKTGRWIWVQEIFHDRYLILPSSLCCFCCFSSAITCFFWQISGQPTYAI